MIKYNVLVYPCSSGIGIEIYNSLKNNKEINLYGLNLNKKSGGYYLYDNYQEFIRYDDSKFDIKLKEFIKTNNINTIIPADDNSVFILKELEKELNIKVITSIVETSKIARSKKDTYNKLQNIVSVPKLFNYDDILNFPVFIKPDNGAGSVDSYKINDLQDLQKKYTKEHIICEYLPGEEFTVECLTDKNRKLICCIPRKRTIVSNGLSIGTEIIDNINNDIFKIGEKINTTLDFKGNWFFQVKYNNENELTLLEISTRLPGASNILRNYGINMILLSIYIHYEKDVKLLSFKDRINNLSTLKIYKNYYDIKFVFDNLYVDFDDTLILKEKVNTYIIELIYKCLNNNKKIYLITRHKGNLKDTLDKYRISEKLFDEIIHIKNNELKSNYIKNNSLFVDDSFQERNDVNNIEKNIMTFDPDSLEILLNNKYI